MNSPNAISSKLLAAAVFDTLIRGDKVNWDSCAHIPTTTDNSCPAFPLLIRRATGERLLVGLPILFDSAQLLGA